MALIFLRSLAFNILFYVNLICWLIIGIPTFVMRRSGVLWLARSWARTNNVLLRAVCGVRVEYRGVEKLPRGALVVASKHQSMWETFGLLPLFDEALFILKQDLLWIPMFGWYLRKAGMIGVDRVAAGRALIAMTRRAGEQVRLGRQLIIFPEGTRRPVDAPPVYKPGIAQLYADSGVPCVPVALNSGLIWPRRSFLRYPGTLIIEFLDPLPTGLKRREFMALLSERIETATNRLVAETRAEQQRLFGGRTA
jgi:1-acyl-sn-glycerol-3-phosphate acyltransferase